MSKTYKGITCIGSWMLGTACGVCERCIDTKPKDINNISEKIEHVKIFNTIPIPASRPRVTKRGTYIAEPYNTFKKNMVLWAKMNYKEVLEGALGVNLYFYMPIPKSLSKKRQDEVAETYHIKRPDADNLAKAVLDSIGGYAFKDDSQVAQLFITKRYSFSPRIEISIKEL